MLTASHWLRNMSRIGCVLGVIPGSILPAGAQFVPEKGVRVQQWKEPKKGWGFSDYYWLNDHELVCKQPTPGFSEQYSRLDLATGKEQALGDFTKRVQSTSDHWPLPSVFPSPDRKYLAWIGTDKSNNDTLVVATIDGSIIRRKPTTTKIHYPSWSADSQSCFGFLEGVASTDPNPENLDNHRRIFNAIIAIGIKTPSAVQTYPVAIKPNGQTNALSGFNESTIHPLDAPPLLPSFHFGNQNNIFLMSPKTGELSEDILWDEYDLTDTTTPVQTHTMHLPARWEVQSAAISPQGDAIVWKFHQEQNDEFWISDQYGGNLKRIGKWHPMKAPDFVVADYKYLKWLPSGKAISFVENGELYVVYLDAHKDTK